MIHTESRFYTRRNGKPEQVSVEIGELFGAFKVLPVSAPSIEDVRRIILPGLKHDGTFPIICITREVSFEDFFLKPPA